MKTKGKNIRRAALLLACLLLLSAATLPVYAAEVERPVLLVGGIPFGVRFFTEGVMVVGYCDVESGGECHNPARAAGLLPGDCIYKINEVTPGSAAQLADVIQQSEGAEVTVHYKREGAEHEVVLKALPCDEDGRLRMGLFVRDSGAGIGTVTFMMKKGNTFAGLGHGICDAESGMLIPLSRGSVLGVTIGGVQRGGRVDARRGIQDPAELSQAPHMVPHDERQRHQRRHNMRLRGAGEGGGGRRPDVRRRLRRSSRTAQVQLQAFLT